MMKSWETGIYEEWGECTSILNCIYVKLGLVWHIHVYIKWWGQQMSPLLTVSGCMSGEGLRGSYCSLAYDMYHCWVIAIKTAFCFRKKKSFLAILHSWPNSDGTGLWWQMNERIISLYLFIFFEIKFLFIKRFIKCKVIIVILI